MRALIYACVCALFAFSVVGCSVIGDRSISPDITIRRHSSDSGKHEIWICDARGSDRSTRLYEYDRHADVLLSPDSEWIVVSDYVGSDSSEVIVFRRAKGTEYTREPVSIRERVWREYCLTHGIDEFKEFDHCYVRAVKWVNGSRELIVQIYGHDANTKRAIKPYSIRLSMSDL